jgi:Lipocalin-like domain
MTWEKPMRLFALFLSLLFAMPAHADDGELRLMIVGTWKLVSVVYEDQATKERTPVYGEHPKGIQIATPEGRWLALVTAEGRPIPKTDEERAQALKTMIAYTGRYRVEGGKVITKVEAAWNEAWVGGEQVRNIRFQGDRLYIESPPMPHPNINNKTVRVIVVWERENS